MYENKLNHKKYIGQSTNIARRKKEHLKYPSKYSRFDNELRAIGEDQFLFTVLEQCTIEELDQREIYWIKYYNSKEDGYNLVIGGQSYRGESNPAAKLTEDDVRNIIDKLRDTKISIQNLAKEYGVHYNTISNINRCKTWNWLHEYTTNIRLQAQGGLVRGELSSAATITEQTALNIINDIKNTTIPLAEISRKYKIRKTIVYDINRCKTWKHLHHYQYNIRKEYKAEGSDANNEDT